MESCLQPLWDLLYGKMSSIIEKIDTSEKGEDILAEKSKTVIECKETINSFFEGLEIKSDEGSQEIKRPEHIKIFYQALDDFAERSVEGIIKEAGQANAKCSECKMCAVCMGCAAKFYDNIIKRNIIEKRLPYNLENYFISMPQMFYYDRSMHYNRERMPVRDKLHVLKGFSSSTPMIYSASFNDNCVGGGFYLNWKGTGIVIDPGIGFVTSMHKNGIYINDIDVVIITHDHLDHNADAETIASLLHDFNKYHQNRNKIVRKTFELPDPENHEIVWIIDESTKKKLKNRISHAKGLRDYVDSKGKEIIRGLKDIKLNAIRTKHIKESDDSYGIKLKFKYGEKEFAIGYTSDTSYFNELEDFFQKEDILVFNVSDLYRKDVRGIKNKSSHLGYNGSIKLLKNTNYRIGIASEFCCTNDDFRLDFINSINHELERKKSGYLLPGEIGLKLSLPGFQVECSICGKNADIDNIKVLKPRRQYGKIQYICGQCAMNMI